jgi:DNA-binding MarR family transcriptional regulator/ribosomal protein S18 acetylase RimI-like enzyme
MAGAVEPDVHEVHRDQVARVRRFNRTVTQRIGALQDRYLARDRPLGASRVLWEIGADGCELRSLRSRLGLDAGYLSRLLRALEADGLVVVAASAGDGRVRRAELTSAGRRERRLLDRRSDELAASLLGPLPDGDRAALVEAMGRVDRLLTAALVTVDVVDPTSPEAQACLAAYFAELDERFDAGFDPARSLTAGVDELRLPHGLFVVASLHGEPVGCGGVKLAADRPAYVKRMWVARGARGLSLGRRLLAELESLAAAHGATAVQLETNRSLVEAIAMYRSSGYRDVAPFNDEVYADHWFEKPLGGASHAGNNPFPGGPYPLGEGVEPVHRPIPPTADGPAPP